MVTMPTLSGAMVVLRGFSNATEQDKAKAAIRRTIVKRLAPYVERRVGSIGKQILCKLFAAQKSAKIDA